MQRKIIDTKWRSGMDCVGITAVEHNYGWCAYIGVGVGLNADWDAHQHISHYGAKLQASEAAAFFPSLDITKYQFE